MTEKNQASAVSIIEQVGTIERDAPWKCSYTDRAIIHIGQLASDIQESALGVTGYCAEVSINKTLVDNFTKCMQDLYPA